MRKLKHGLTMADRAVEEKVKAMQRQKDAIGFITTLATEAGSKLKLSAQPHN
jgi:hypothetical protein